MTLQGCGHVVYVAYAREGTCLYVGMSSNFEARRSVHRSTSLWALYAEHWEQIPVRGRREALALERITIRERMPLFNVSKNEHPVEDPYRVLMARLRAGLVPEAAALLAKFESDGDEHAYAAAVAGLPLQGVAS